MNTQEWLNKISDKAELQHWLTRQYIGEITAARRIKNLADSAPEKYRGVLSKIANDELQHSNWVMELLVARNIPVPSASDMVDAEDRYWKPILKEVRTFDEITAAGHHAEGMRLVRIRALTACDKIDEDIRSVFQKILPDEEMHERAFKAMSSKEAVDTMSDCHEAGLELLGLEI
jgi:rubrerythrin